MANETASVSTEDAPPSTSEPNLPDTPLLPKSEQAQKAMKEPAKPLTPVASADANKGNSAQFVEKCCPIVFPHLNLSVNFKTLIKQLVKAETFLFMCLELKKQNEIGT